MIIFGWGRQTIKQIGVTFKQICGHCKNEEYWVLSRTITWFTLFFIPIIPYSIKYFLSCPICQYGLNLNKKQVNDIKPLAEINQMLLNGEITENDYQIRINQLNKIETNETIKSGITDDDSLLIDNNLSYCSNCGTSITKKLKFCGNCGTQVELK